MKLGAENRKKVIAAIALGVVALVLLFVEFGSYFSGPSTSTAAASSSEVQPVPESTPRAQTTSRSRSGTGKKQVSSENLDPTLRYDLLKASEDTNYSGTGRNIFRVFVEPPPKPIVPVTPQPQAAGPAAYVPPPPPPIDLKFYGFATPAGGTKRIFLAKGEDVFIAKEGDIVDRRYKVMRISNTAVDILDVLSNNRQSIPLIQG